MRRIVVITSLLFACDVGQLPGVGPDASMGGGDGSGSGSNACVDTVTPAAPAHLHAEGGTSNAGLGCMDAGCHLEGNLGADAPAYTFAGTVYTDATGTTPKAGATVWVDFNGTRVSAVSDAEGNFYSMTPIELPAQTSATACPLVLPMVGLIVTGGGNCNNCHKLGAGAQAVPVYVP